MLLPLPKFSRWPVFVIFMFSAPMAFAASLPPSDGGAVNGYTQTDVLGLIAYILLALIFSFLCSVAEAVLLSITLLLLRV